jgi:quercetin dioxygenase-like cupin family protein
MKVFQSSEFSKFSKTGPVRQVLFDSPGLRISALNFEPGQEMPVHEHHADAEVAFLALEGEGVFTREDSDMTMQAGALLVMPVREAHGFRASTRLRLLVFIAPPF